MTTYRLRMKSFATAPVPPPAPAIKPGRFARWTGLGTGGNFDLAFGKNGSDLNNWQRAGQAAKGTAKLAVIGGTVYGASSVLNGVGNSFTGKSGNNNDVTTGW